MVGNALVPQQPMREFSDTNFPTPKYNERVSLLTAAALLYRQRSMACLIISTASAYCVYIRFCAAKVRKIRDIQGRMPTYYSAAWVLFGIFSVPVSCTRFAANLLTQMFMRLGRAEKAGSGVDKIVSGWQSLGWPLPTVAEETRPDYVVLTLQLGMKTRQENPQENLASRI